MAGRTILIADDEPHLVHMLDYHLKKRGATVKTASNGLELIEIASVLLPDLIVSDYQMPYLDGLEASKRLRIDPRTAHIPVIMLTARGHRLTPAELSLTQIRAIISKPFSGRQLLAKIEEILAPLGFGATAA